MAVDWNIVDEIRLFRWVSEFKPVGIHRHFHMFCILERMNNPDKYPVITLQKESYHRPPKLFTSKDIWLKLKQYYNLDEANRIENEFMINHDDTENNEKHAAHEKLFIDELKLIENNSQFNNTRLFQNRYRLMTETKDFSLPWDEYGDLILSKAIKKKNSVANKEKDINKDGRSRVNFTKNVGEITIEDNKKFMKANNIQSQNQNVTEQEKVLASGNIDNNIKEEIEDKEKIAEKFNSSYGSYKNNEDISKDREQNENNNNIQTNHTESTQKDVEKIEEIKEEKMENGNYESIITQANTKKKTVENVKDTDTIEKHKDSSFKIHDQGVIVENLENDNKIESQTETKTELNYEIENIEKQGNLVLDKTSNESENIQVNEQTILNKEKEKEKEMKQPIEGSKREGQKLRKEENKEPKESIQKESSKDMSHAIKQKDFQGGVSEETTTQDDLEKELQEKERTEPVQQIQKKQLEIEREEGEKMVLDKEVKKTIEMQELQKESKTPLENHDNLLYKNQDEKKNNKTTEDNIEVVAKNLENKELSLKEGEERIKDEKRGEIDDNEEKKKSEESNEYENQEQDIPQKNRRKRVYPRAHRISSRLRRKVHSDETNSESSVEPVKVFDDQSTEEKKNVEDEKTNLKHKLDTEQDMIDNEPLAKRTRHSSYAKVVNTEDSENQPNGEEIVSSSISSKRGKRKNSNRTLEPTRFSTRLRKKK
ncbi:Eaf7p PWA37_004622 [Arxiozyma heterogenica]|uniref:Eaf7p n=1 Tax=Arxiozyma heterogenica TaxID=278026 RepID=UPI002EF0B1B5